MNTKVVNYSLAAIILFLLLIFVYLFIPFNTTEFNLSPDSALLIANSSAESNDELQFYPNMRFPSPDISYRIENCSVQREKDMNDAFEIIEEKTVLSFYAVKYGEEIKVTCNDTIIIEGNLFTAGEGGPVNVSIIGEFYVIESGKILLLKDSNCKTPNVALHELLHVLGFDHSEDSDSIMYEISECEQTMGYDIIDRINKIYSVPTQPDLVFENASALMHGQYLNIAYSIRNNGLKYSGISIIKILANEKEIQEIEIPAIEMGEGIQGYMINIFVKQIGIEEIEFIIENDFEELHKLNNRIYFSEIKK